MKILSDTPGNYSHAGVVLVQCLAELLPSSSQALSQAVSLKHKRIPFLQHQHHEQRQACSQKSSSIVQGVSRVPQYKYELACHFYVVRDGKKRLCMLTFWKRPKRPGMLVAGDGRGFTACKYLRLNLSTLEAEEGTEINVKKPASISSNLSGSIPE